MNARTFLSKNNSEQRFRSQTVGRPGASIARRPRRQSRTRPGLMPKRALPSHHTVWLEPQEQDRLLRQRSLSEARQGNYADAITGLTILIDRNPEGATDYNNRGLVHFQQGQLESALEDYNQAIKLNPKLASAYNNRANYHAAQGDLAEAIADYETAIDLDPTNIRAWINQGITFRDLEMYAQAIDNFEQALQINQFVARNPEECHRLEAHIYGAQGRTHHLAGDWNLAIADYYRSLDRMSDFELDLTSHRLQTQVILWLDELQT
jgi:tetratricopeptide (TPR) repeat protein